MRLANLDWEVPKGKDLPRKARYVVNPESSSEESSSDSEPDNRPPLQKVADKYRHEREGSSDEDDIPLMELAKRLRARDALNTSLSSEDESDFDNKMQIDLVHKGKYKRNIKNVLKSVVGIL